MHVFHIAPFRTTSYVLKGFGCLEVSKRISNWNKFKISFSWCRYFKYANWKYQYSYTNECDRVYYESQLHMRSVNLIV